MYNNFESYLIFLISQKMKDCIAFEIYHLITKLLKKLLLMFLPRKMSYIFNLEYIYLQKIYLHI